MKLGDWFLVYLFHEMGDKKSSTHKFIQKVFNILVTLMILFFVYAIGLYLCK